MSSDAKEDVVFSNEMDKQTVTSENGEVKVYIEGMLYTPSEVTNLFVNFRNELACQLDRIHYLENELVTANNVLQARDRYVDQLRSVLDQKIPTGSSGTADSSEKTIPHNMCTTIPESGDVTFGNEEKQRFGVSSFQASMYSDNISNVQYASGMANAMASIKSTDASPQQPSAARAKRQGVSGESLAKETSVGLVAHPKDERSRNVIRTAVLANDYLKHIDESQIKLIVDCMYEKRVHQGCYIIREGQPGDALYVTDEGILEVSKENRILGRMEVGRAFGELALLYNCNRTATVRAVTHGKFWTLDRRVFQTIMMSSMINRHEENLNFLQSVTEFKNLSLRTLNKLADVLELVYFNAGHYIIREGEVGETFFIIKSGKVVVTQTVVGKSEPDIIRQLSSGDWFGEKALYTYEKRSANIIAQSDVDLLTLDRSNFIYLIGDLSEIRTKDYGDNLRRNTSTTSVPDNEAMDTQSKLVGPDGQRLVAPGSKESSFSSSKRLSSESVDSGSGRALKVPSTMTYIPKEDLQTVAILGIGGFGRVELVLRKSDPSKTYALKCMPKAHIVETRQEGHIFSEKNLMLEINSPFICKLYCTYRDNKYVYMLLEACLGGELWTVLRNRGSFNDNITRFVVASVLEAFTYLHTRGILYRDLKPENLLLDSRGYIKMCDFGFAKKIGTGKKTWTFCGTPEYVAPEIILNKGHDHSADYWSLGILTFELLTGSPPFTGIDPMKIYNVILRGIEAAELPMNMIGRTAAQLIKRLCAQNPVERLGYGRGGIIDIKQHKYFNGFDWIGLHRATLIPPIIPQITSCTDVSNFDKYPDKVEEPANEMSNWDADF